MTKVKFCHSPYLFIVNHRAPSQAWKILSFGIAAKPLLAHVILKKISKEVFNSPPHNHKNICLFNLLRICRSQFKAGSSIQVR